MKIGIITRETKTDNNTINGIPISYLNIIKKYGYPIIIDGTLNIQNKENELLNQIIGIDAFIIPGGDSINDIDLHIIDYCYKNNIPLLGICLGMQEIAYYFDKNNIIPLNNDSHFNMKEKYLHSIKINKNSYLYKLLKTEKINVNSRHRYTIQKNKHYTIQAKSDNVIEAIKVKNKKYILGVQFHPEIMYDYDFYAKKILDNFFNL